jgi:hypothetical protein
MRRCLGPNAVLTDVIGSLTHVMQQQHADSCRTCRCPLTPSINFHLLYNGQRPLLHPLLPTSSQQRLHVQGLALGARLLHCCRCVMMQGRLSLKSVTLKGFRVTLPEQSCGFFSMPQRDRSSRSSGGAGGGRDSMAASTAGDRGKEGVGG